MVSRAKALSIIKEHGWLPWTPTAWWPATGSLDYSSSFYAQLGDHPEYKLSSVMAWLGY